MSANQTSVLILDPDDTVREALSLRLGLLEVTVMEAATVAAAQTLIQEQTPSWLICDWSLEGLEGVALFKTLGFSPQRIWIYTARDEAQVSVLARDTGVKGVYARKNRFKLIEDLRAEAQNQVTPANVRTADILVVDDSASVRLFVRKTLEPIYPHASFREADSGRSALNEMTRKKVDFIVTDLEMPGMDGEEFIGKIRNNPLLKKKPLLVFSGKITDHLLSKYRDDQYLVFLRKPCLPEAIITGARTLMKE